jgi:hypothetical protein
MREIQRPVADLCKQGDALGAWETWVNRTLAIFMQLDEMCQGVPRSRKKKITKKCAGGGNLRRKPKEGSIKGFRQG